MKRAQAEGRWLEYEESGSGEPVLLIHGTLLADSLAPLIGEPGIASGYRVIRYRRRGFCGNLLPQGAGWLDIADHAADAAMLLGTLGIENAHVVGHDLGGVIALQLALDEPQLVHSLALLEPILLEVPSAETVMGEVSPALDMFLAGHFAEAVDLFLRIGSADDAAEVLERQMPGGLAQAVEDCPSFFKNEIFAIGEWRLPAEAGFDISQPVLSVCGEHPIQFFTEGRTLLHERLPQTEDLDLFNTTHLLPIENPEMLAAGLVWFLGRHPIR